MRMRLDKALKLLALWLLAGVLQAQDDPPGRVGRLAAVQGDVRVLEAGQGEWSAALPNRPFTGGERLSTAPGASVELHIGSTTVFLGGQTEFEALRLDDQRLQFRLQRGQMALRLRSPEVAAELEILHPEARFLPQRAGLYRIDRLAEASDATVWQGELRVEAHNLSMTLYAGQRAAFWREGALGDTTRQWLTQQQDEFALAVQRADQADAQLAAPLPPEMTGAEDLQRYGSWQQHPEFGAVWTPTTVAAGWAPYRYGQWVWMNPWGWTWVDAAPWGFAPFHYGRWLWWGNRWAWSPGPRGPKPPPFSPAVVGWVGPPPGRWAGRPAPPQGWVPLGPRDPYRPHYPASPPHLQRIDPRPGAPASPFVPRNPPPAGRTSPGPVPRPPPRETAAPRPAAPVTAAPAPAPGRPPAPGPAAPAPERNSPQRPEAAAPPPATGPFGGRPTRPPAAAPRDDAPKAEDRGERRRIPESRPTPRERER